MIHKLLTGRSIYSNKILVLLFLHIIQNILQLIRKTEILKIGFPGRLLILLLKKSCCRISDDGQVDLKAFFLLK